MGVLLMMTRRDDIEDRPRPLGPWAGSAGIVFLVVIAGNIVQAFASTGPPPFMGQGDPVRFSLLAEALGVVARGMVAGADLALAGAVGDRQAESRRAPDRPGRGADCRACQTRGGDGPAEAIGFPLSGTPTDFLPRPDHEPVPRDDAARGLPADETLAKLNRHTVVDAGYAVDLGRFAGAAFVDKEMVLAVGENKSYVVLAPTDKADADANFRFFLASFDRFDEESRSRFGTVRARMMYVMSAAYDPATKSVYTVTVPNNKVKTVVVSRFGPDRVLSEEFSPTLGADTGLALTGKRSLGEFYVTGATIGGGRMYAISAAFNTLLTIDLATRAVVAARAIPASFGQSASRRRATSSTSSVRAGRCGSWAGNRTGGGDQLSVASCQWPVASQSRVTHWPLATDH